MDVFFFQAEDGIRDAQESRGLGDVYKRQIQHNFNRVADLLAARCLHTRRETGKSGAGIQINLSLIHI